MKNLTDEVVIHILTYLRSIDLLSVREVDKTIFSKERVSKAIHLVLDLYNYFGTVQQLKNLSLNFNDLINPKILYIREITAISFALNTSPPPHGKGKVPRYRKRL
jgi:hypothetical protein